MRTGRIHRRGAKNAKGAQRDLGRLCSLLCAKSEILDLLFVIVFGLLQLDSLTGGESLTKNVCKYRLYGDDACKRTTELGRSPSILASYLRSASGFARRTLSGDSAHRR